MDRLRQDGPDGPEHVHLLVTHFIIVERVGRLHGNKAHDGQQVILHHVPQGPGVVIIVGPVAHPVGLRHGDLHVVDVVAVPDGLEQGVGKAKGQDVLDRLFAQIVVDAKNLGFVKDLPQGAVQGPGRGQVMAKGLFHHDAGPLAVLVQPGLAQLPGHRVNHPGRQAQIKDAVGLGIPGLILVRQFLGQIAEDLRFIQVRGHEVQMRGKARYSSFGLPRRENVSHLPEVPAEFLVGGVPVAGADDQKLLRQPVV